MAAYHDSSGELLKKELGARVRDCVQLRDWVQLEHWAKHWIQLVPRSPDGFKWLARSSVALKKLKRAAYAYGRLLDFDPDNAEAKKFFADYPSTLDEQSAAVAANATSAGTKSTTVAIPDSRLMTTEQRQALAVAELKLAQQYDECKLFGEAAERYLKSFD